MEENEKPFGCMTEGCNMRFTNEDHLTVHKKKHDMILNLGNGQKMNIFVADQTPTPTRFIRNCEEVGLFQDLQNVNPFEETFRKAVEAGKSGLALHDVECLHIPSGGDDTLHTPHVFPFPHMNDEPHSYKSITMTSSHEAGKNRNSDDGLLRSSSSDCTNGPIQAGELFNRSSGSNLSVSLEVPNIVHSGLQVGTFISKSDERVTETVMSKETVNVAGKSMQLYLRMPDGQLVHLVQENSKPTQSPNTPTHIPSPENGLALAKLKLKQALKKSGRIPQIDQEVNDRARVELLAPSTPSFSTLTASGGSSHGSGSGEDEDEKKLKFRERNRAAAMRCREKRKTWVQELERRAEDMQSTNQHLQSEVTSLRAEVAQLKTLLLAHKNCPITQAMNQAQMVNMSSVPIATIQHSLVPISHRVKTVNQQTPTTSQQNSFIVLKKPSKVKKTNLSESTAKRKRLDQLETPSASSAPQKLLIPAPQPRNTQVKSSEDFRTANNCLIVNGGGAMSVHSLNVAVQSVVVANPVTTTSQSMSHPQLLMPLPLRSAHPPPLITFNNSTACASNENNLNLEKMMNNRHFDTNEEPVCGSSTSNALTIDGSESKVIKVNPNAIRFNSNRRREEERSQKNLVRIVKTGQEGDNLEIMVYAEDHGDSANNNT